MRRACGLKVLRRERRACHAQGLTSAHGQNLRHEELEKNLHHRVVVEVLRERAEEVEAFVAHGGDNVDELAPEQEPEHLQR